MNSCFLVLIFAILIYTAIYYRKHVYCIRIYSNNPIIRSISSRKVYPLYIIPFGFFQTVFQLFRKVTLPKNVVREHFVLKMEDGGEILIDVYETQEKTTGQSRGERSSVRGTLSSYDNCYRHDPCDIHQAVYDGECKCAERENVLLVHGLNGSSRSTYIIGMAKVFLKRDCRVFCYNARGALLPPKNDFFSHHGLTSDLQATVEHILHNYQGRISLVGFSLGSNWVAKLLGEYSHPRIRMGIAVCCPFDFHFLSLHFKTGCLSSRIVGNFMSRNYKRYLHKSMVSQLDFKNCRYMDEIDKELLRVFGKTDVVEFYKESSSIAYIPSISVPCLFISAIDDPVIPSKVIPFELCMQNENTGVVLLKGGHLGFFTNRNETMAEVVAGEFFDKVCAP